MGTGETTLASECPYQKTILQGVPPVSQIFWFQLYNDPVFIFLLFPSQTETSHSTLDCGTRKHNPFSAENTISLVLPPEPIIQTPIIQTQTILQKVGVSFFLLKENVFDASPSCELSKWKCSSGFSVSNCDQCPVCTRRAKNKPTKPHCSGV